MTGVSQDLLQRCKKGDRKAQSKLYETCFGYLMSICLRYTHNEDDAHLYLNLAFFKILTKLGTFKVNSSFKAWIKTILINTILDEIKKKKRYRQHVVPSEDHTASQASSSMLFDSDAVSAEEIYGFIRNLPAMTATVFNLYAMDGYKHKEIGEKLGMSENTSKWHYHEAKKRLQKMVLESIEKKKAVKTELMTMEKG
jgi:RNA polymerase sigma-70 factor (ECF subfamily)